jgi:hypothetical protein
MGATEKKSSNDLKGKTNIGKGSNQVERVCQQAADDENPLAGMRRF